MNQHVDWALPYLHRAVQLGDVSAARQALEQFGRGALEGDAASAVAQFGPEVRGHAELISRAVASLGSRAEMRADEALPEVLYARSGYQVLLDAAVWDEPPLSGFHLGEVDESLGYAVGQHGVGGDVPPAAPASHVWWRAPAG